MGGYKIIYNFPESSPYLNQRSEDAAFGPALGVLPAESSLPKRLKNTGGRSRGDWTFRPDRINKSIAGPEWNTAEEQDNQVSETSTLIPYSEKISRAELAQLPAPPATRTHVPILLIKVGHPWRRR